MKDQQQMQFDNSQREKELTEEEKKIHKWIVKRSEGKHSMTEGEKKQMQEFRDRLKEIQKGKDVN